MIDWFNGAQIFIVVNSNIWTHNLICFLCDCQDIIEKTWDFETLMSDIRFDSNDIVWVSSHFESPLLVKVIFLW